MKISEIDDLKKTPINLSDGTHLAICFVGKQQTGEVAVEQKDDYQTDYDSALKAEFNMRYAEEIELKK